MFWNKYPYTDFHELNLDMILRMMQELHHDWDEFRAVNEITNAGAWDITKQYQAWTIVSDNNAGYISLKPVPVGVAITNTEYWGLIADYDILITDLSNRISALENSMASVTADLANKENKVTKILIVGDSYLDRSNSYGDFLTGYLTDATVILRGEAGAGFTNYSTLGGKTFEGILDTYAGSLTPEEKASFTDIVVIGGSNDRGHAGVGDSIDAWYTKAKAYFTNARMHLGFMGWTGFSNTYQSQDKRAFLEAQGIYKDGAIRNGAKWIENLNYIMHDYSHFADEGHPDTTASDRAGKFLYEYFKTGHADVKIDTSATFTLNSTNFNVGTFDQNFDKVSGSIRNGFTRFCASGPKPDFKNYGKISLTTTGLPANGGAVTLLTLSGGAVFGIEYNDNCEPVIRQVTARCVVGGNFVYYPIGYYVQHGILALLLYNGVADWSQVTNIVLPPLDIVIPTDFA